MGSLLALGTETLLVAGSRISAAADRRGDTRAIGTCMATGQAAGLDAALAVESGRAVRDIDVDTLRKGLEAQGTILDVAS